MEIILGNWNQDQIGTVEKASLELRYYKNAFKHYSKQVKNVVMKRCLHEKLKWLKREPRKTMLFRQSDTLCRE